MNNLIDVNLSAMDRESAFMGINATKLAMPYLIKLSDNDRKSLQMMDDGRKPFVEKCIDYASHNPALDPGSDLIARVPNDISLYSFLSTVENELLQVLEMVHDTRQLAGAEAYEVARMVYLKAKMNVQLGIPGSQSIADDLGQLYKQNGASAKTAAAK